MAALALLVKYGDYQHKCSVNNATLNRFFALHYLLPFILVALVLMHVIALHDTAGSSNPLGISGNYDRLPFAPYFLHLVIAKVELIIIITITAMSLLIAGQFLIPPVLFSDLDIGICFEQLSLQSTVFIMSASPGGTALFRKKGIVHYYTKSQLPSLGDNKQLEQLASRYLVEVNDKNSLELKLPSGDTKLISRDFLD